MYLECNSTPSHHLVYAWFYEYANEPRLHSLTDWLQGRDFKACFWDCLWFTAGNTQQCCPLINAHMVKAY